MSPIEIRPFRRSDREQLTYLVNVHAAAVIPGISVSVNILMNELDREPGEFVVDPWVIERATLVAVDGERVVGSAHLLRYGGGPEVGEHYRNSAEIRWLLFWPERRGPYWPDPTDAADPLMAACIAQLDRWGVSDPGADGSLPVPGVYGVPEQWPHIRNAYQRAGFVHAGHTEIVHVADVGEILRPDRTPLDGLRLQRTVGINGTRLSAVVGAEILGYIEVESREDPGRISRHGGWSDIGNLRVAESQRRRGIGTWLMAQAADWLRLGRYDRVLDYTFPEQEDYRAFLRKVGFRELTWTQRGWRRNATLRPTE